METAAPEPTDADLLALHRAGSREAFGRLYRRYAGPLYFYVRSLVRHASRAEDVVQEVFLRMLDRAPQDTGASLRAYLYSAAANRVRDELRKARVRRDAPPPLVARPTASPPPSPEVVEEVSAALDRLPDEQREVVALKIFSGLTFAEIESVTGLPAGTVMSRYRYALERLADLLKGRNA